MEKEKTDKKDHILDVAERVFAEVGYDGASTRMISGEAGVNMAMLNYYFGSKEGLLLAIFARRTAMFQNLIQKNIGNAENISSWEKVELYIDAYIERVFHNNCFQKMLYQELAISRKGELTDKITEMIMLNVNELTKILQEGIERGDFKTNVDRELVIATLFGAKNFLINTPHISSLMFGFDITQPDNLTDKLKPRLKTYMKSLLKVYLVN